MITGLLIMAAIAFILGSWGVATGVSGLRGRSLNEVERYRNIWTDEELAAYRWICIGARIGCGACLVGISGVLLFNVLWN